MKPGAEILTDLALRTFPASARIADLGGPLVPPPALAARRVVVAREDEALTFLQAQAHEPLDGLLAGWPTRFAPLLPFLSAARGALRDEGRALLLDLTWGTAPTPDLLRAFAPAPGRDKVRPIEGYEMQIDHAGFDVEERVDVDRARWAPALAAEQKAAVEADARGAARLVAWVLAPRVDG
ncbi:MAG TPA: hypothetical protein VM582_03350 [Candidatus Thermoplasmatota archaeon]|nr:hypothetical protein [Candidatus Thermoplasmatota archaeon]